MNKKDFEKHVISEARKMLKEEADKKRKELESITIDDIKSLAGQCRKITESFEFNDKFVSEDAAPNKKIIPAKEQDRFSRLVEYTIQDDKKRDVLSEIVQEERVFNEIKAALEAEMHKIQEVSMLEEAVTDVIKKYLRRGVLTVAIIANLLSANVATAQQFENAGVDPDKIEMAAEKAGIEVKGRPDVFNFAIVRGMAFKDTIDVENIKSMETSLEISDYKFGSEVGAVEVPYKLTTSENLNAGWGHQLSRTYDSYKTNVVKGTTNNKNYVTIGAEDESPITYTVSDYPMEIEYQGDTLQFVGFTVIQGQTRNKNAFFDNKGVSFAKLSSSQRKFIPAQGKTAFSIKGNSVSINLVYGKGLETTTEKETPTAAPLEVQENDLFKYNRTTVQTDKDSYKKMINDIQEYISKNPDAKFKITVHGNASQVPTSYDNTKPNNNLGSDFKSIPGEAKVQNNKMLAQDRADALLKQVLVDLKTKDPDILKKVTSVNTSSDIGKIEYENDPQNASKYAPDQYAKITIQTVQ